MKFAYFLLPVVIVFTVSSRDEDGENHLVTFPGRWKKVDNDRSRQVVSETPCQKEPVERSEERTSILEHRNGTNDEDRYYGPALDSSLLKEDKYGNSGNKGGTRYYNQLFGNQEVSETIQILLQIIYGVPLFFGYYKVYSYLNEICTNRAPCNNISISVTSTKVKSSLLTETAVLTSMKMKLLTRKLSETATTATTRVATTTLSATSPTYRTNTETERSTITTTTTTQTKRTFTFVFSETTTTTGYSLKTRVITIPKFRRELLFYDDDDDIFIEIFPTDGEDITSTYAWSKFSAVMSLETTTVAEDDEEWSSYEKSPDHDVSQRFPSMSLEGSRTSIIESSNISSEDY